MNLKKLLQNLDTNEPILIEWALYQIKDKQTFDEKTAKMIEEQVFNDVSIWYMISHSDSSLLTSMFRIVPARRFSNYIRQLVRKWPEWRGDIADWSATIIAQIDPDAAGDLFTDYCQKDPFGDLGKWHGVFRGLVHLPNNEAARIANIMTDAYLAASDDKTVRNLYTLGILELTWKFEHPEFENLFRQCIRHPPISSLAGYRNFIIRISEILGTFSTEYVLISNLIDGYSHLWPGELKFFYENTIPPKDLDNAVRKLKKRSFRFMTSFFRKHKAVIRNEPIRMIFDRLISDKPFISHLDKKKQQPHLFQMILTVLMASLKKEKIDLSGCSAEEAVTLLSADIDPIPDPDAFASFFKAQKKADAVRCLTNAFEKNAVTFGGKHILEVMGALGYDEFLRPMADGLNEGFDYEFIYLTAQKMLLKYGERATDFLSDYSPHLNEMGKLAALDIVRKIGGPKSVEFTDKYFDTLWDIEKEYIPHPCQTICDKKYLRWLKPKIGKGQPLIDETYLIISLLTRGKTAETEKLLRQYYEKKREHQAYLAGGIQDKPRSYIDAELECKNCGDKNIYRVTNIIVGDKRTLYVAQEIECINCHVISEFEMTSNGHKAMMAEMLRMTAILKSGGGKEEVREQCPIKYQRFIALGEEMDVYEAVSRYRALIDENPRDAGKHIGLGNVYLQLGLYIKAGEYFNKAIEIDPSYIQAYYALAQIADKSGEPDKATELMERGEPYFSSWKYRQGSGPDRSLFFEYYCTLYNSLLKETKSEKPRLRPSFFQAEPARLRKIETKPGKKGKKIGRNAPCPCGRGRKYKKCCMNK